MEINFLNVKKYIFLYAGYVFPAMLLNKLGHPTFWDFDWSAAWERSAGLFGWDLVSTVL